MEYRETGLPQNPTIYKAFMTFTKNVEKPEINGDPGMELPPEALENMTNFPVRVAQLLNSTGAGPTLVSLAMLSVMPPETYGVVEKSFGKEMVELMQESARHDRTGFAYIAEASDAVKLLTLASSVASFEDFQKLAEKTDAALTNLEMGQPPADGQLMIPVLPDTKIYDRLGDAIINTTSSPQLEALFTERFVDFRIANDQLKAKISSMGLDQQLGMMGMGMPGSPDNEFRYPSFEETKLLDDPKVRGAYELLTRDGRVLPEDFEGALEAAQLLSTAPATKNPLAVAGALIDVGIRAIGPDDFPFLDKKLDWDVIDLVKNNSVRRIRTPQELLTAPEEFRQIAVASAASSLSQMKKAGSEMIDGLANEEQIPEQIRPMIIMQTLQPMAGMANAMYRTLTPVLGKTGAPEIDAAFTTNMKELKEFIESNTKSLRERFNPGANNNNKPPEPPKKKGFGQDFSLD
ncbi:MAG: hypothetical protein PW788_05505 [Micavibrio sp.]|nr:hypothetical protein [Micavibrio sp.]